MQGGRNMSWTAATSYSILLHFLWLDLLLLHCSFAEAMMIDCSFDISNEKQWLSEDLTSGENMEHGSSATWKLFNIIY